ncbi:MAG TPA: glycosyltransferase family 39 protein [Candidatus Acidoferrales bacterium]|nr:glycosyltransferase family 39 protein [Candidatus Acidoferrales bacterium]
MEAKRVFSVKNVAAAILAAAILWICLFCGLASIGLVGPDEPRYAWIARNMAQSGNWIEPMLYGKPWFEKPILYYWSAAIGFKFLHSPEWAARLPSSLAALAAVLAMAWLAWRRYGASTAWTVLMILPTCFGVIGFSRAAAPDMLFAASLALAMACAAAVAKRNASILPSDEAKNPNDKVALIFLGVWLGVATLAKGPAAIILAGGSVVLWALVARRWKAALRMLHPLAIACFAIVALPWYILCGLQNPDFFRVFILQHNFGRYLTPEFHHRQPFWFFVPIILAGMLPWTAMMGGLAVDAKRMWRERTRADSLGLFAGCWVAFPLIFFSFSQSKLPGYILPAIPPLALLIAHSFARATESAPHVAKSLGAATGVIWFALAFAAPRLMQRLPAAAFTNDEIHQLTRTIVWAAITAGILILLLSALGRFVPAAMMCAAFVAGLTLYANERVLPRIDPYISARALAKIVPPPLPNSPRGVPLIGVKRNCEYGVRFYRPEISFVNWDEEAPASLMNSFTGYALAGPDGDAILAKTQLDRHFVRGNSKGCTIEFLTPKIFDLRK